MDIQTNTFSNDKYEFGDINKYIMGCSNKYVNNELINMNLKLVEANDPWYNRLKNDTSRYEKFTIGKKNNTLIYISIIIIVILVIMYYKKMIY